MMCENVRGSQLHLPPLGHPQRQQQNPPGPPQPDAAEPAGPSGCLTNAPELGAAFAPGNGVAGAEPVDMFLNCFLNSIISSLSRTPLPSLSNMANMSFGVCKTKYVFETAETHTQKKTAEVESRFFTAAF
jgi:hypothetical protein